MSVPKYIHFPPIKFLDYILQHIQTLLYKLFNIAVELFLKPYTNHWQDHELFSLYEILWWREI